MQLDDNTQARVRNRRRNRWLVAIPAAVLAVLWIVAIAPRARGVLEGMAAGDSDSTASYDASSSKFSESPIVDGPIAKSASTVPSVDKTTTNLTTKLTSSLNSIFTGATYAVNVVDMSTGGTVVGVNVNTQYTSASTYKLYVAYSMISAVESGEKTWNSELDGQTLRSCFATMIVNSDNDCPTAWLNEKGFATVNQQIHDAGFTQTTIAHENMLTDAADLAKYLTRLYQGSFMDSDSRSMLLGYMKTQVYRSGIPAGIGDNGTVADKVGFLDDLLHDASIIYTAKGDYVMVILTNESSWASIAQAASTIYAAL